MSHAEIKQITKDLSTLSSHIMFDVDEHVMGLFDEIQDKLNEVRKKLVLRMPKSNTPTSSDDKSEVVSDNRKSDLLSKIVDKCNELKTHITKPQGKNLNTTLLDAINSEHDILQRVSVAYQKNYIGCEVPQRITDLVIIPEILDMICNTELKYFAAMNYCAICRMLNMKDILYKHVPKLNVPQIHKMYEIINDIERLIRQLIGVA